jgi:hypothetical protein
VDASGRGQILRYYSSTCLEGLRKTTKMSVRTAVSPDRDLKLESPEYDAGVLTTPVIRNRCAAAHWCATSIICAASWYQVCRCTLYCHFKVSGVTRHTVVPLQGIRCAAAHCWATSRYQVCHFMVSGVLRHTVVSL